jgi:hypothetical protein
MRFVQRGEVSPVRPHRLVAVYWDPRCLEVLQAQQGQRIFLGVRVIGPIEECKREKKGNYPEDQNPDLIRQQQTKQENEAAYGSQSDGEASVLAGSQISVLEKSTQASMDGKKSPGTKSSWYPRLCDLVYVPLTENRCR